MAEQQTTEDVTEMETAIRIYRKCMENEEHRTDANKPLAQKAIRYFVKIGNKYIIAGLRRSEIENRIQMLEDQIKSQSEIEKNQAEKEIQDLQIELKEVKEEIKREHNPFMEMLYPERKYYENLTLLVEEMNRIMDERLADGDANKQPERTEQAAQGSTTKTDDEAVKSFLDFLGQEAKNKVLEDIRLLENRKPESEQEKNEIQNCIEKMKLKLKELEEVNQVAEPETVEKETAIKIYRRMMEGNQTDADEALGAKAMGYFIKTGNKYILAGQKRYHLEEQIQGLQHLMKSQSKEEKNQTENQIKDLEVELEEAKEEAKRELNPFMEMLYPSKKPFDLTPLEAEIKQLLQEPLTDADNNESEVFTSLTDKLIDKVFPVVQKELKIKEEIRELQNRTPGSDKEESDTQKLIEDLKLKVKELEEQRKLIILKHTIECLGSPSVET